MKVPDYPWEGKTALSIRKKLWFKGSGSFLAFWHTGFSSESASAGKFCTFEKKNPWIGPMSINRFSPGFANCQTSGFLLLLHFARKFCWKCLLLQKSKNTIDQFLAKNQSRLSYETTGNLFISVFLAGTNFTLCHSVTNGRCLLTVSACICFSLLCTKCIYRLRSSSSVSPKEKPHWFHWGHVWYTRELHLFESVW